MRAMQRKWWPMARFFCCLLNGMRIARGDIVAGLRHARFLIPLIFWVFGAMALVGLGLSRIGYQFLPPVLALGFLYLGCLPSTVQSATSYSSLAGGNVALSVISAALLNILGVFISVPIFLSLGGSGDGAIGADAVVKILAILILPFAIGQLVQKRTQTFVNKYKKSIVWMDRAVIAIAVYVAFSGAVEQGIWSRVDPLGWITMLALTQLYLFIAHAGAWASGGALRLSRPDRIAFLFAGAQKSAAIGVPLATVLFSPEMAGFVVLPLLLITCRNWWWRRRWLTGCGIIPMATVPADRPPETDPDQHRTYQSGYRFRQMEPRRQQQDHTQDDDRPKGAMLKIAIFGQCPLLHQMDSDGTDEHRPD